MQVILRKRIGVIAISFLIVSPAIAESQSNGLIDSFASLPGCAASCRKLFDVQQACIPPLTKSSLSQSCFCNDLRLKQFLEGPTGVAAVCNASVSSNTRHTYTITTNEAGEIIIGTQTVPPNGSLTIEGGEVITFAPQATTSVLPGPVKIGSSIYFPNAAGDFIIGTQTLTKGGVVTVEGQTVSLSPDNSVIVNGEITMSAITGLPETASKAAEPVSSLVIAGQTIALGGQITVGGNVIEFPLVTRTMLKRTTSPTPTAASGVGVCTAATDFQAIESWYQNYCQDEQVLISETGLSKGAQAGIGIGTALLGLVVIGLTAWFFFRGRKQKPEEDITPNSTPSWEKAEMDAGVPRSERMIELGGEDTKMELKGDGGDLELVGDYIRAELEGDYGWAELDEGIGAVHSGDSQSTLVNGEYNTKAMT